MVSDIPAGDGNIEKLFLLCIKGIFFNLDDEMPELEGVALPFLTKQTFPEWPLPPLKRQDFTHKICPGWDCHQYFIPKKFRGIVSEFEQNEFAKNEVRRNKKHKDKESLEN